LIVCTEEDGRCKDTLECLDDSPIVTAVLRQVEEVEHLRGALEINGPTLLLDGERGYPYGDEPILAEGETESWMTGDFQEEISIASGVDESIHWRAAKRDTT